MGRKGRLDPEQRRREKQASREADARRLAAGEITAAELARENGFFADLGLPQAQITSIGNRRIGQRKP